ncbi:glycosyltransferase [Latilactobacillus fragifolii]|uniref:glycosyltransferase n=1 Tax=Latilactobacillus fragifolii TaxID=2814244 RepID=UPI001ABB47E6|nr:glycosyltransferase [Latilactobacillus fragifolii]
MKIKVDILVPYLSGQGGMETVAKKVAEFYNENREIEVRLVIPQGTIRKEWIGDITNNILYNDSKLKIKSFRNLGGLLYLINYLIFHTRDTDVVIGMSSRLVRIISIYRRVLKKNFFLVSWIHFSIDHEDAVRIKDIKKADYHLAISSGIKRQLTREGIPSNKIKLIYNPVEKTDESISRSKSNTLELLYMGRVMLDGQKNLRELFLALSKLEIPWHLKLVGDGKQMQNAQELAKELSIKNKIDFCGWLQDPWKQITNVDYLILTSKYEGLPMVLIEAIERGLPCIAANCPTGPEDIINERNGYLYEVGNIKSLVNKLIIAHKNKYKYRKNTVKDTATKFLEENYFARLTEFFKEIKKNKGIKYL